MSVENKTEKSKIVEKTAHQLEILRLHFQSSVK